MNTRKYFYKNIEECLSILLGYYFNHNHINEKDKLFIIIREYNNEIIIMEEYDTRNDLSVSTDRPNVTIKTMSYSIYYKLIKYRIYFRVYNCWEYDKRRTHRIYCKYLKHKREYIQEFGIFLRQKRKKLYPLNDVLFYFK